MQDLTTGPLSRHLLKTTSFMLVMMVFQTLYFLIDLYWVGRLGTKAVAAVAIAGNLTFIVLALSQMLGIGTTTVIAHAAGDGDRPRAKLLFNQAQVLATLVGVVFLVIAMAFREPYSRAMSADAETAALTSDYLLWFLPAMGLQFVIVAMGSALRGIGDFKTGTVIGVATVIINMALAPILIFGWFTGRPFGVAGAALATLFAVIVGALWISAYFVRSTTFLQFDSSEWRPRWELWKRMLAIGAPVGFEFAVMTVYLGLVYAITRPFGAAAQAGFGVGMRIVQAGFMPIVALGMAVAPVAGQNFGARKADRVKGTFKDAAWMAVAWMALLTVVSNVLPAEMVDVFTEDAAVVAVGAEYLHIISLGYIASGLIFVASSMFQAMGNTMPSLLSSAARIAFFTIAALALVRASGFRLSWLWYLSVSASLLQLALTMLLLRREFRRRLEFAPAPAAPARVPA